MMMSPRSTSSSNENRRSGRSGLARDHLQISRSIAHHEELQLADVALQDDPAGDGDDIFGGGVGVEVGVSAPDIGRRGRSSTPSACRRVSANGGMPAAPGGPSTRAARRGSLPRESLRPARSRVRCRSRPSRRHPSDATAFFSKTSRRPRVSQGSCRSISEQCGMTTGASPPVAMAVASGSVDRIRATIVSTWPAVPDRARTGSPRPCSCRRRLGGATALARGLAVRENRLAALACRPGAITPPRNSPFAHHVEVRSGAEVDDDRRSTGDRRRQGVRRDRPRPREGCR